MAQGWAMAKEGNTKTNISYKDHLKNKQDFVRISYCLCSLQKGSEVYVDLFFRLIEWYQELRHLESYGVFLIINYLPEQLSFPRA